MKESEEIYRQQRADVCTVLRRHGPLPSAAIQASTGLSGKRICELVHSYRRRGLIHFDKATGLYSLVEAQQAPCAPAKDPTIPNLKFRCPFCMHRMPYSAEKSKENHHVWECNAPSHASEVRTPK